MRYAFVIDQSRCIGCHACSLACKAEHEVPLGSYRTWVKYVEKGSFPDVRRFFSVLRCNHCDNAPCVTICPVTALFRRDDGIIDFDRDVCIGCKACMQACPYDALYMHPDNGTAEKCNFCAHRVEKELEPPCATVCPTEAIVVGDMDDKESHVSRLIATKQVSVRKPEKGTVPKVFYIEGEPAGLIPGVADPSGGYMWADRAGVEMPNYPTLRYRPTDGATAEASTPAPQPGTGANDGTLTTLLPSPSKKSRSSHDAQPIPTQPVHGAQPIPTPPIPDAPAPTPPAEWLASDLPPAAAAQALAAAAMQGDADFYSGAWAGLSPARTVYDVAHTENPWGWKVSAYLWTKSIAAGAFVMAALAPWIGLDNATASIAAPLIGLIFLALTGVLLVADLKKPARFWTILTRPNWDSWLARGAFIIAVFGALATAWTVAVLLDRFGGGSGALQRWLRWPVIAAAVATAAYSGYLFAQAKGRDFWQSPLLPLHLSVQALAAGAAALVLTLSHSPDHSHELPFVLVGALALHLALIVFGEVTVAHATRDGALAAHAMVRGRYARGFWTGIALAGVSIAAAAFGEPLGGAPVLAGIAALASLGFYEHAWNLAGQAPPLS